MPGDELVLGVGRVQGHTRRRWRANDEVAGVHHTVDRHRQVRKLSIIPGQGIGHLLGLIGVVAEAGIRPSAEIKQQAYRQDKKQHSLGAARAETTSGNRIARDLPGYVDLSLSRGVAWPIGVN